MVRTSATSALPCRGRSDHRSICPPARQPTFATPTRDHSSAPRGLGRGRPRIDLSAWSVLLWPLGERCPGHAEAYRQATRLPFSTADAFISLGIVRAARAVTLVAASRRHIRSRALIAPARSISRQSQPASTPGKFGLVAMYAVRACPAEANRQRAPFRRLPHDCCWSASVLGLSPVLSRRSSVLANSPARQVIPAV